MLNLGKLLLQAINECDLKALLETHCKESPARLQTKGKDNQLKDSLASIMVWNLIPVSLVGFPYPHSQSAPGKGQLSGRVLKGLSLQIEHRITQVGKDLKDHQVQPRQDRKSCRYQKLVHITSG